jgi:hypothetical protein
MEIKSPFDFVTSICSNDKTSLLDDCPEGRSQYLPFIINRSLSYHSDTVLLVNEMNRNAHLGVDQQYDFLRLTIRPRRRFAKWVKPEKNPNAEVIAEYYNISTTLASTMVDLIDSASIKNMKKHLDKGGIKLK